MIELLQNQVAFEADGKGHRDLVMRVQIKSESAVREFALLPYAFAAVFESLDIIYARVRKPDGAVVESPPSDVQGACAERGHWRTSGRNLREAWEKGEGCRHLQHGHSLLLSWTGCHRSKEAFR